MSRHQRERFKRRRRKFELAIADVRAALANPEMDERDFALYCATHNLYPFIEEAAGTLKKAHALIDVTRLAREARGVGRDHAEEKLMEHLDGVARVCCEAVDAAGFEPFLPYPDCSDCPANLTTPFAVLREVCAYALECFAYRRARDPFAGRRRAAAFEILGTGSWAFSVPDALPLALAALKQERLVEAHGAISFLEDYFGVRETEPIPDEIVEALLAFAGKNDHRSNATGALNVLVEGGVISEFDAMALLDEWKECHPWA